MRKRIYTVMGATGHVGQTLTQELLRRGHTVLALGRDPHKLSALKKKGAHVLTPSFDNKSALTEAFKGVDGVFTMIPPSYGVDDFSAYQNHTGEVIVQALRDAGVTHQVDLSSIGADQPTGTGPIANLHQQEKRLEAVANLNSLHLRPAYFMENLFWSIPVIKSMGILGTALRPDLLIPMVATHDIGVKAAEILEQLNFTGHSVFELGGPQSYTLKEATKVIGKAIGQPDLAYVQFSYEEAKKGMVGSGMKDSMADLMIEMNKAFNENRLEPTQSLTDDHQGKVSLEEFAKLIAVAYAQN